MVASVKYIRDTRDIHDIHDIPDIYSWYPTLPSWIEELAPEDKKMDMRYDIGAPTIVFLLCWGLSFAELKTSPKLFWRK